MSDVIGTVMEAQYRAAQNGKLSMWTVYDHPKDFPDGFIARRFEVDRDGPKPTMETITGELGAIRLAFVKAGLTRLTRNPEDEAQIVECWL